MKLKGIALQASSASIVAAMLLLLPAQNANAAHFEIDGSPSVTKFVRWKSVDVIALVSTAQPFGISLDSHTITSYSGSFDTDSNGNITSGTLSWNGDLVLSIPGVTPGTFAAYVTYSNSTLNLLSGEITGGTYTCVLDPGAVTDSCAPQDNNPDNHNYDVRDYFMPRDYGAVSPDAVINKWASFKMLNPQRGGLVELKRPGTSDTTPGALSATLPPLTYKFVMHGNAIDHCWDSTSCLNENYPGSLYQYSTLYQYSRAGNQDVYIQIKVLDPSFVDSDHDGLSDAEEAILGTDPLNPDTDGDGLTDYQEAITLTAANGYTGGAKQDGSFDPLNSADGLGDHDGDGISNAVEVNQTDSSWSQPHTDYRLSDTDGDGMPDKWEIDNGFDPTNPADATLDADGDGANNLKEYTKGTNPRVAAAGGVGAQDGHGAALTGGGETNLWLLGALSALYAWRRPRNRSLRGG